MVDNCLQFIKEASGRDDFTEAEAEAISREINHIIEKAKAQDTDSAQRVIERAVNDLVEEMNLAAKIAYRNAALNHRKTLEVLHYIRNRWSGHEDLGLRAVLIGVATDRQGARSSVATSQEQLQNQYINRFVLSLKREGLLKLANSRSLDREIFIAMHELGNPDSPRLKQLPREAVRIAQIIEEANEIARKDANNAGAWIKKLPGYVVKRNHDEAKVSAMGREGWKEFVIRNDIDWERSFPDATDQMEALDSFFTAVSSGVHYQFGEGGTSMFKGVANIGRKMSYERILYFKTPEGDYEYHKRCGLGGVVEGVAYGLEHMAQNTALMRHLGPNAEANIRGIIDQIGKGTKDPEVRSRFDKEAKRLMAHNWPLITGEGRVPENKLGAKVSAMVRAQQQMAKLGFAVMSATADVPIYASAVRYEGGTMLGGMGEAIGGLLKGKTTEQQDEIIAMLGVLHDGMRASSATRFSADDYLPGHVAKTTQLFFKLSLLRWWTDRLRTNFALAMSHRFALHAKKTFDALPDELQRSLRQFGIDADKWDLLRAGTKAEADGRLYMTPEGLDDLPDEAFSAYLQNRGLKPTAARIRDLKIEIKDQFGSYFHERSTTAVVEPNVKTRGTLLRGTRSGTVWGEIARHVALFKTFAVAILQRPLAREVYGRSSEARHGMRGLYEALASGDGAMTGLVTLLMWNTLFGYIAMSLKDLVKGREPRDLRDDPVKVFTAAMLQGGALGIYGDFLFGDLKNRYGGNAISTIAGPTAGTVNQLFDIWGRAKAGDPIGGETLRAVQNNTPFINLFYLRPAMDYLFFYRMSEAMSPGYLRRMEQRIERDLGQGHLLPPSSVVPYGGG